MNSVGVAPIKQKMTIGSPFSQYKKIFIKKSKRKKPKEKLEGDIVKWYSDQTSHEGIYLQR